VRAVVKLKRLKIERYRDVEPCELRFSDRFNVLLGPNGAGKTTLLELISSVLRSRWDEPGSPVSLEVELASSWGTISGRLEAVNPEKPGRSDRVRDGNGGHRPPTAMPSAEPPAFCFEFIRAESGQKFEVRRDGDHVFAAIDGKRIEHTSWAIRMYGLPPGGILCNAIQMIGGIPGGPDEALAGEMQDACRFDEALDVFRALTARRDTPLPVGESLRPQVIHRRLAAKFQGFRLVDTDALGLVPPSLLAQVEERVDDARTDISFADADLPFLAVTVRLLGLRAGLAKFELARKWIERDPRAEAYAYDGLAFWFTRRDGSIFQDQHLSYGQKRLLAFLYYLDANPSIVIADELVNGLHHAWIEECVRAIGERQAFLTSQNPLLLDYLAFDSVEQVKETFILCRTEPDGDRDRMIWRNMNDDEADMFFRAYKVGVEHVGEILRTRGLW
jgi:energy-coupling factor transporter ATP-binding protein EcfA2